MQDKNDPPKLKILVNKMVQKEERTVQSRPAYALSPLAVTRHCPLAVAVKFYATMCQSFFPCVIYILINFFLLAFLLA